jgi:hypothetical protein
VQIGSGGKRRSATAARSTTSAGRFDTKQEAALAYDRQARQCGKDKLLNYESIAAAEEAAAQAQAELVPTQPNPEARERAQWVEPRVELGWRRSAHESAQQPCGSRGAQWSAHRGGSAAPGKPAHGSCMERETGTRERTATGHVASAITS